MNVYTSNIVVGALTFPLLAFVFTLPYMIYQYRKFGSIPWLRTLIAYSFIFYVLVAYYMVILPLPENRSAITPYAKIPQLVPFNFLSEIITSTTFSPTNPSTWFRTFKNPFVYQALFNVLLLVPLGMYLRYYFRRNWWQTFLLGLSMTLFYELSQLTGLWGIYEHAYRLFDVDDLILNTFGTMVGFWITGPILRILPDIRLVNEEAREAGLNASVTRRALSFVIDSTITVALAILFVVALTFAGVENAAHAGGIFWEEVRLGLILPSFIVCFVVVPTIMQGQTFGQKLLRLRTVKPNASPAHWYQYLVRYGLLYLLSVVPFLALSSVVTLDPSHVSEMSAVAGFVAERQAGFIGVWTLLMSAWVISLIARAVHSSLRKTSFVMLNGLISNTRVMTVDGAELERERRQVLDVATIRTLERMLVQDGTSLRDLMERAGCAVADEVCAWVPDPSSVVVLTGAGNNGGDGWVVARILAERGYFVTLIAPNLAERLSAEPARSTARAVFAQASSQRLSLHVLIAPEIDIVQKAIDDAAAIVDAMLGTGFIGDKMRDPYASWIQAAQMRRFEGTRKKGRGLHRKRLHERGNHEHGMRRSIPTKVKDAPFAISIDTPSGLSAQTGSASYPCFSADMTVTMIAFKPGLVSTSATRWTGHIKLAKLAETKPYLEVLTT